MTASSHGISPGQRAIQIGPVATIERVHLSLILTSLSLMVLSAGILLSELDPAAQSLAASYHPVFYVGLGILLLAAISSWTGPQQFGWINVLHFAILVFALYATPVLLEGAPRPRWSFAYFGWTQYILDNGILNGDLLLYHNWPGLFLLSAAVLKVTGVESTTTVLMINHYVMPVSLILPGYLLYRNFAWPAAAFWAFLWILTTANWLDTTNYQPQGMAMFLLLLLYALLVHEWRMDSHASTGTWRALALLVFGALAITHFATALIATVSIALLFLLRRRTPNGPTLLFAIAIAAVFGTWAIYGSTRSLELDAVSHLRTLFRFDLFFRVNLLSRVENRGVQESIVQLKLLFWAITVLIAGAGLLLSLFRQHRARFDAVFLAISTAPLVLVIFPVYLGEDLTRIHLLMLIPLAYFAAKLTRTRVGMALVAAFLLVAMPLHLITHYGSEIYLRINPPELSSLETFSRIAEGGYVIGGFPLGHSSAMENFQWISWPDAVIRDGIVGGKTADFAPPRQQYVALGAGDEFITTVYSNDPDFTERTRAEFESSQRYSLIYSNPSLDLYYLKFAGWER